MKKSIRKYFISVLSFLLILSNFSYAANIMVCGMMDEGKIGSCCSTSKDNTTGENISNQPCCISRSIELSNSTNQLNLKREILPRALKIQIPNLTIFENNLCPITGFQNLSGYIDNPKIPEDIPILISSLLI